MNYLERMARRLAGQEDFVPSALGAKDRVRQLAELVGVRTATLHQRAAVRAIDWGRTPEEFVLKPAFASTSIGVLLLRRSGGVFTDLLTGAELALEELVSRCDAVASRYYADATSGVFLVEQLLRSPDGGFPPADVRCYCFQGDVGLIIMEHHITGPATAMYFDGDFLPFPDVALRYSVADGAEHLESIAEARTPTAWAELLGVARRVSVAVPSAFCRVDLYDCSDGVHLGEVTLYPGTFYYRDRKIMSQSESERLGRLWGLAEARLVGSSGRRAPTPAPAP